MQNGVEYIEVSRFTYLYENIKCPVLQVSKYENIEKWTELEEREKDVGELSTVLPLSHALQRFWSQKCSSFQTRVNVNEQQNLPDLQIFVHSFPMKEKKIFLFETKIKMPFSQIDEALEIITASREKIFLKIIKSLNSSWRGEYSADDDYFYFINMKLDFLAGDLIKHKRDVIEKVKEKLTIDGKCIFEHFGFTDKQFPKAERVDDDLSFVIQNEKQPLVVVSPTKDINKFIIPDDKLFIRCYKDDSISLPIRVVIKTLLFQKAFIEYASTASVNIAEASHKNLSYISLSKAFSSFIDYLWRVEISNSYYLNKSYRVIGKIWLLNEKFENLKNHIDRNSIFEDRHYQNNITRIAQYVIVVLGIYTIISGVADFDQLIVTYVQEVRDSLTFRLLLDSIVAIFGAGTIALVSYKLTKLKQ